jgi:hypothetical protein
MPWMQRKPGNDVCPGRAGRNLLNRAVQCVAPREQHVVAVQAVSERQLRGTAAKRSAARPVCGIHASKIVRGQG